MISSSQQAKSDPALFPMIPIRSPGHPIFSAILPKTVTSRDKTHPTVAVLGAGNLAHALGPALRAAGYRIESVASRSTAQSKKRGASLAKKLNARSVRLEQAAPAADIIWLCHTDDALSGTAR